MNSILEWLLFHVNLNYIGYVFGLISCIYFVLYQGFNPSRARGRFQITRRIREKRFGDSILKIKLFKQYHFLLSSSVKQYRKEYLFNIVIGQIVSSILIYILVLFITNEIVFSFLPALFFSYLFPIGVLYFRHKQIQYEIQDDLEESIILLMQSYQKRDYNMLYAMKDVTENVQGSLKVVYSKLYARLHGSKEEKVLAAETFAFQVGYMRGKSLAILILKSLNEGENIELILVDMTVDITEFNKRTRDADSESKETAMLGLLPIPITLIFIAVNSLFLIPKSSGKSALYYHFYTPLGLKIFIITMIIGLINLALALVLKRPKKGL